MRAADREVLLVHWLNAASIPGLDPAVWRMAICGQPVAFGNHGDAEADYAWLAVEGEIIALTPLVSSEDSIAPPTPKLIMATQTF